MKIQFKRFPALLTLTFWSFVLASESAQAASLPLLVDGGHYAIVSRHSGKCVDVTDWSRTPGQILQQWDCNYGQENQTWRLVSTGMGSWAFFSDFNGMCIDVANRSNSNGAALVQSDQCYGPGFNTSLLGATDAAFKILFGHSGKCMDVKDWAHWNGAKLQQWDCPNFQANQEWHLIQIR